MELRKLPKVELHAHLNGSISMSTMRKLMAKMGLEKNIDGMVLREATTMEEVFKLFPLIQRLTATRENLKIAASDVIKEFKEDGVVYLELRTTPKTTTEMSPETYVDTVLEAIREADITVTLILSIDRRMSDEEADRVVSLAVNDESGLIVGVELSGDPSIDGTKFLPQLQRARNAGLGISVHLAEVDDCLDEVDAFLNFGPDRIGHGTFLHTKEPFVRMVVEKRIPFEICLTSNTLCRTTPTVADSHFGFWRAKGIPIAICTDDKGLMADCTLSSELEKAAETFGLTERDLKELSMTSFNMSFAIGRLADRLVDSIRICLQ